MNKVIFILLLALGPVTGTYGQSASDLDTKYPRVVSYEIHPGILMTPKYAPDGQVCEMVLERRQMVGPDVVFGSSFSEKEVKKLVDELAPETERGKNMTEFLNTTVDGGFLITEYNYENVLIRVYGVTRPEPVRNTLIKIIWRKRSCGGSHAKSTGLIG
jgi:hypothetical protein